MDFKIFIILSIWVIFKKFNLPCKLVQYDIYFFIFIYFYFIYTLPYSKHIFMGLTSRLINRANTVHYLGTVKTFR